MDPKYLVYKGFPPHKTVRDEDRTPPPSTAYGRILPGLLTEGALGILAIGVVPLEPIEALLQLFLRNRLTLLAATEGSPLLAGCLQTTLPLELGACLLLKKNSLAEEAQHIGRIDPLGNRNEKPTLEVPGQAALLVRKWTEARDTRPMPPRQEASLLRKSPIRLPEKKLLKVLKLRKSTDLPPLVRLALVPLPPLRRAPLALDPPPFPRDP